MTVKAQLFTKEQIVDFMQRVDGLSFKTAMQESIAEAQARYDFLNQGAGPGLLEALKTDLLGMENLEITAAHIQLVLVMEILCDRIFDRMVEELGK